ncbi:MAG TPA: universal stress protein [Acidimicrobiia bacterium]
MTLERILVGVDGSTGAQHALLWCAEVAGDNHSHVYAVHAISNTWLMELEALQLDSALVTRKARSSMVGQWTNVLRERGVECSTDVVVGDPASSLLERAARYHADLIVLGASRHRSLRDELLGGTAHRVVNRSTTPVVVVPSPRAPSKPSWVPLPG